MTIEWLFIQQNQIYSLHIPAKHPSAVPGGVSAEGCFDQPNPQRKWEAALTTFLATSTMLPSSAQLS